MGNMAQIQGLDIKGLVPALDFRKIEGIAVVSGKNFKFDSDGPLSGFGNDFLTSIPLGSADYVQTIKVDVAGSERVFMCEDTTILEWNESLGYYTPLFIFASTASNPYRWTSAYVNGFIFFCHPAINGILYLNVSDEDTGYITEDGLPDFPTAIAENNGRLIIMTPTLYAWSDPSDGFGWVFGVKGGAGFQIIADRVSGNPIMMASTGNVVLTFTSGGVLRSEFTGDFATYRHRALQTDYGPINSFCIVKSDDATAILLDRRGLFKTSGGAPEPWTPTFNEYLRIKLENDPYLFAANSRIDWDVIHQTLYLSLSNTDLQPLYDRAYVIYPALDKWGSFDEDFYGICGVHIAVGDRRGDYFGYVDSDRRFRIWDGDPHVTNVTINTATYEYKTRMQFPVERITGDTGRTTCCSTGRISHLNEEFLPGLRIGGGRAGHYTYDGGSLLTGVLAQLDAFIEVGLFRFSTGTNEPEETEIQFITITSAPIGSMEILDALPSLPTFAGYGIEISSTFDGITAHNTVTPVVIRTKGGTKSYGVDGANGLWHKVKLSADVVGQSFHLRYLELQAILSGVME